MNSRRQVAVWVLVMGAAVPCWAQFEAAPPTSPGTARSSASSAGRLPKSAIAATQPRLRSTAEKRQWLKQGLETGLQDRSQVRKYGGQLDRFSPKQIDVLTNLVLAQQLPQDAQQVSDLARLELERLILLRRLLERELYWRRQGGVGYMPVITWLPQGTSMGARAVISPDGRYVRVSPSPFFSSIGPVYSYNLGTGATRLQRPYQYYPYGYGSGYTPQGYQGYTNSPGFGQMPQQHVPQRPPASSARPETWHDGIRTRVGPR